MTVIIFTCWSSFSILYTEASTTWTCCGYVNSHFQSLFNKLTHICCKIHQYAYIASYSNRLTKQLFLLVAKDDINYFVSVLFINRKQYNIRFLPDLATMTRLRNTVARHSSTAATSHWKLISGRIPLPSTNWILILKLSRKWMKNHTGRGWIISLPTVGINIHGHPMTVDLNIHGRQVIIEAILILVRLLNNLTTEMFLHIPVNRVSFSAWMISYKRKLLVVVTASVGQPTPIARCQPEKSSTMLSQL